MSHIENVDKTIPPGDEIASEAKKVALPNTIHEHIEHSLDSIAGTDTNATCKGLEAEKVTLSKRMHEHIEPSLNLIACPDVACKDTETEEVTYPKTIHEHKEPSSDNAACKDVKAEKVTLSKTIHEHIEPSFDSIACPDVAGKDIQAEKVSFPKTIQEHIEPSSDTDTNAACKDVKAEKVTLSKTIHEHKEPYFGFIACPDVAGKDIEAEKVTFPKTIREHIEPSADPYACTDTNAACKEVKGEKVTLSKTIHEHIGPSADSIACTDSNAACKAVEADKVTLLETIHEGIELSSDSVACTDTVGKEVEAEKVTSLTMFNEHTRPSSNSIACTDANMVCKDVIEKFKKMLLNSGDNKKTVQNLFYGNSCSQTDYVTVSTETASCSSVSRSLDGISTYFVGARSTSFLNLNTTTITKKAAGDVMSFRSILPLPDLVNIENGEEDEVLKFADRAKLFRFDSFQNRWIKRGVGDIKILKHKQDARFRIVLRQDYDRRVVCNHYITKDMSLCQLSTCQKTACWNALDYSTGLAEPSNFAACFRTENALEPFRRTFRECVEVLKKVSVRS